MNNNTLKTTCNTIDNNSTAIDACLAAPIYSTKDQLGSWSKIYSGKVRDLYAIHDDIMLVIASDRLSAYDVVLPTPITNKGVYLNQISLFWFDYLKDIMPNHLLITTGFEVNALEKILHSSTSILAHKPFILPHDDELAMIAKRSSVVKRLKPLPIEIIVRGYLAGNGYNDYKEHGGICGIRLPQNLQHGEALNEPIFTPTTKAPTGQHDENISLKECARLIGDDLTMQVEYLALQLYQKAANFAKTKNIIIADTKFEFGINNDNQLVLIDEVLTPDSSRFWDQSTYQAGKTSDNFDKQFVRDYLLKTIQWNKLPPIPSLPKDVVAETVRRYQEITNRLGIAF